MIRLSTKEARFVLYGIEYSVRFMEFCRPRFLLLSLVACVLFAGGLTACGDDDGTTDGGGADASRDASAGDGGDERDGAMDAFRDTATDVFVPANCQSDVESEGWNFCSEEGPRCSFVFSDSTGCPAACARLGLRCEASYEDIDDMCAGDLSMALDCNDTGHISDYCVCATEAFDAGVPDAGADSGVTDAGPFDGGPSDAGPPGEVLAFPSARGAGAYATGGRGGRVIPVTTLADSGPGSLRAALEASGPRIIVFRVSGVIDLASSLIVDEDDFTILGQTAPEGGITLTAESRPLQLRNLENFIIRYIRVRPEYAGHDAVNIQNASNYIIDHVSVSWGGDETMSTTRNTENVTFQRVLFAESKTGSLFGDSNDPSLSRNLSFHHNAFYNITHRHPNVHTDERSDTYNNVIYNWRFRWSVMIGDGFQANHMNNYYAMGCLSSVTHSNSFNKVFYNADAPEIYSAGNLVMPDFLTDPSADNSVLWDWRVDVNSGPYAGAGANTPLTTDYQVATQFPLLGPSATVDSAMDAYADVAMDVGANARVDGMGNVHTSQDTLDAMYLQHIRDNDCAPFMSSSAGSDFNTTDHYMAFHAAVSSTPIATRDDDRNDDGIPDAWATARGFDASEDLTTHVFPSGYVGVEEYANAVDR